MKKVNLVAPTFVMTAVAVILMSWWTRGSLPISAEVGDVTGNAVFIMGMASFTWTLAYLRRSFFGEITPISDRLVKSGPYRWIRHPLYLSMLAALLGISVTFRSLWGLLILLFLFLPAAVYRARLEEKALIKKFGREWTSYVAETSFLLPWFW